LVKGSRQSGVGLVAAFDGQVGNHADEIDAAPLPPMLIVPCTCTQPDSRQ
jgi:hypothetical protein